jgi:oxygen-independent coproporphyrinogen-3 oxidase
MNDALGVYVHVPFCASICNYCNFNRGLLDEAVKRRYVDAVVRDIARAADGAAVDSIYFGGGTPSLLSSAEIDAILRACRDAFEVRPGTEVTLEANPETVDLERLAGLRAAGVNRLSFGVQSFRDEELRRLDRRHDADGARRALRDARRAGFDNISLDLMMWLPGQRPDAWLSSVEALIDLGPEHASLYLLELYPNAPLKEDMARAGWSQAPDDDAADMYLAAMERLERAGLAQYEISNVARPTRMCRHNLKYWRDGEWLAFGCGAHGTRRGVRWRNVASATDYIDRVVTSRDPRAEVRVLAPEGAAAEAMITGLRLSEGVDVAAVEARYHVDVRTRVGPRLEPAFAAGYLCQDGTRWTLTRPGMLMANEILAAFV